MNSHLYEMPDGDVELGDFPARRRDEFITINWILTEKCNLHCRYCCGPRSKQGSRVLTLSKGIQKIVDLFERIMQATSKYVYVNISGGEPSLEYRFTELCAALTRIGVYIQPQTNFLIDFKPFFDQVDRGKVAYIDAGYHNQLEEGYKLNDQFMKNVNLAHFHGVTCAVKYVADERRMKNLKENLDRVKSQLPEGVPINIAPFIKGYAMPKGYSSEEKNLLLELMTVHKNSNIAFWNSGLGQSFKNMKCAAGKDVLYMDIDCNLSRCLTQGGITGGIHQKEVKLFSEYKICGQDQCSCTQRALWFGLDPWNYVSGVRYEDAFYNRFGPNPMVELSY